MRTVFTVNIERPLVITGDLARAHVLSVLFRCLTRARGQSYAIAENP